jgi:ribosomal protein L37AE/L43A
MNRVQFQPGLSMAEFMRRYGTQEQCEAALCLARWPQGFACPECGGSSRTAFRRQGRLYWQCSGCQHQCSLTSGTIFQNTKLPLTVWFLAMHLLTQAKNNVAALELMRHLGVCYRTAWLIKHKLLEVMRQREEDRQLTGRIEMDDAYLGGERHGGTAGRGSENKVAFVAAVQTTESGRPHLVCYSKRVFTKESLKEFMSTSIALPATVVSDGLSCFTVACEMGMAHDRTVTGGGRASVDLEDHWAINTVLGNLKTAMAGTYHAIKFAKYAHRYLAEVQYRFNRRYDLRAILPRLVRAATLTPKMREAAIRAC